ncbi:hypothetical protein FALCPG4_015981 [Fusarium falciforme]
MEADYNKYLSSLYPNTTWSTTRLSGGLVNTTVRATQMSSSSTDAPKSVIVKHARPYIEAAGPEWAFTTKRQVIEAIFLNLFSRDGALFSLRKTPFWNLPQCLYHQEGTGSALGLTPSDEETSVLVLSDLGNLVNIFDFLIAQSHRQWEEISPKITKLAYDLGTVFAAIHSPETITQVEASYPQVAAKLTHSLTSRIIHAAAIKPLLSRLKEIHNAEKLYARVEADFCAPTSTYSWSLTMGDFTQCSILMRSPNEADDWTPTLVDWEFGKLNGRGVNGDVAQFLAHLHCELLSYPPSSPLHRIFSTFTSSFCAGYAARAKLRFRKQAADETLRLLRGTFITHGREMVNQAWETYKEDDRFEKIWSVGLWYLQRAGDSVEEFMEGRNWEDINMENGRVLLSLFEEDL